jgi:hypothetical protein
VSSPKILKEIPMTRLRTLLVATATLVLLGCPSQPTETAQPASPTADTPTEAPNDTSQPAAEASEAPAEASSEATAGQAKDYDVVCGCTLPDVGHCGEYAKVGDAFLEITGDLGLGSMPFCGKKNLKAKITGEVQEGKLAATALEILE